MTYTVGRGITPVAMAREPAADPYIVSLFKQTRRKPWVEPVPSSHIWKAQLPPLAPGAHDVTVRVADEYGREQVSRLVLETDQTGQAARPA